MSAAGRGAKRKTNDQYFTPEWLTRAFLPHLVMPLTVGPGSAENDAWRVLEPCAGNGAIVRCLKEQWPLATITSVEIDPKLGDQVEGCIIDDFLTHDFGNERFDLIITNPPFNLAKSFIKKSMTLAPMVAMLLRLNFLGGQKRAEWMRSIVADMATYVTPKRPPFCVNKKGKLGTDATDYCWLVWGTGNPRTYILETEDEKYKTKR